MPKTIRAGLFIRNKRFRKKLHLNIMGLKVLFDVTTSIYSLFLVVYLVAAFFITSDIINESRDFFIEMEEQARRYFWFILAVLPFRYVMQSFQKPGIVFSTSDYKLSMLPYGRGGVWLFACIIKWIKSLLLYIFIGVLVMLVTPISFSLIFAYLAILFSYDILFTVPIWKLFQERASLKWASLGGVMLIGACTYLLEAPFFALIIPLVLLGLHMLFIPQLFKNINWGRVTEVSDYTIWNMPLVSRATKTSFKRSKRYSAFRQSKRRKRPFKYTYKAVHHRLWLIYFGKNINLIVQLVGVLLLLLSVLAFIGDLYFHIGLAISLYIYTNVCSTFYQDRFQSDILRTLPWELVIYKQTFLKWAMYGAGVLSVPIVIYGIINWSMWEPIKWLFYGSVFLYMYHLKIDKAITRLSKRFLTFEMDDGLGLLFVVMIVVGNFYPIASLSLIICMMLSKWRKKQFQTLYHSPEESVM